MLSCTLNPMKMTSNGFDIDCDRLTVKWYARTESTNKLARESTDCRESLWIADYQTNGRGQRGNHWHSADGENLMFTLSVFPNTLLAEKQFQISEITAMAVCDALALLGIKAQIKWPNDIYVGDKKICGILIEHDLSGRYLSRSIIGVGINVNQCVFDPSLPNPTSVKLVCGCNQNIDRNILLQYFITRFFEYYDALLCGSNFDEPYTAELYRKDGSCYPFRLADGRLLSAEIVGVDACGRLQIKDSEQNHYSLAFKEIEYIIG